MSTPPVPPPLPTATRIARIVLWSIILPIPAAIALAGAWVGSTLAVFHEYPVWLVLLLVPIAFGLLPWAWEHYADRDQVGGRLRDAVLRSSFFGLVLIGILIATHAETTYKALATRGDWFLAGSTTPAAESIRRFMFRAADGFAWVHELARDTLFEVGGAVESAIEGRSPWVADPADLASGKGPPGIPISGSDLRWPLDPTPHPSALRVPVEATASPEALGAFFKAAVSDELMRAKAIHDWVALHIAYDHAGLLDGSYTERGRQSAETVLQKRTAVCAGFSRLFVAVAEAAGLEARYVSGAIRWNSDYAALGREAIESGGPGEDRRHAWSSVYANGHWHLVDTTWDKADEDGDIRSLYLFIPPEAMILDHFPDHAQWQLLAVPTSVAQWWRLPNLDPAAVFHGIRFLNVDRPVVPRRETLRVELDNPYRGEISLSLREERYVSLEDAAQQGLGAKAPARKSFGKCGEASSASPAVFECAAPPGRFAALIFSKPVGKGRAANIGQVSMEAP